MAMKEILLAVLTAGAMSIGGSTALSQVSVGIGINIGPPPPRHEVVLARPAYDAVWIHGHWGWRPGPCKYYWIPGRWVAVRPGHDWVEGRWVHWSGGWAWREGAWRERNHERSEVNGHDVHERNREENPEPR